MIDDPLSIVAAGIWLVAAGMYPIGFLFGACSACCDECPDECSKCGYFYDGTDDGPCTTPSEVTLQVSAGNEISGTVQTFQYNSNVPFAQLSISDAPFECQASESNAALFWRMQATTRFITLEFLPDPCDCPCCTYGFAPQIYITSQIGDPEIVIDELDRINFTSMCDCDETFVSATVNLADYPEPFSDLFLGFPVTCQEELIDWWNSLSITLTLTKEPCECGACCSGDGGCEESPEFYCNDNELYYAKPAGAWQGVGTDCDPNPCEEE